jgi:predicted RNA-binding Zn ribbon-like protein
MAHNLRFEFVGNNVAVDFINTEIAIRGKLLDLLQKEVDLIGWAQEAGFNIKPQLSPDDLSTALSLRWALKEVFQSRIDRAPAKRNALAIINQHLANHGTHTVLQINKTDGYYELVPDETASTISGLLANLAYEAANLLASSQAERLKRCGNADCVLIFVDISRGQKRRWCSMDTCGNRVKAAKYYRSHISH